MKLQRPIPRLWSLFLVLAFALTGPGIAAEPSPQAPAKPPLRLALPAEALERGEGFHARLVRALEKRLAEKPGLERFGGVELRPAASWLALAGDMRADRCDLAIGPPTILFAGGGRWSVLAQERRPGDVTDDRPRGRGVLRESVLIVREGPLASREGLIAAARQGGALRAAFTAPESAAGFLAPRLFLEAVGFEESRIEASFLGGEEDVFQAVANGMADIGALETSAFEALLARHEALAAIRPAAKGSAPRVAAKVQGPSPPLCVSERLRNALGSAAMNSLSDAFREAAFDASGGKIDFAPATNEQYREIVENARRWYSAMPFFELLEPAPSPSARVVREAGARDGR